MSVATAQIPADHDLLSVISAAGGDASTCLYSNGTLTVPNVTQAALDAAVAAYNPLAATPARAQIMLAAGCQIASTSTPALNGTYACDPAAQSKIQAMALYIQVNGKFPAAKSSLPWVDASGAVHIFNGTAEFQAFATAIGDYVTELEMVMLGQSTTLPTQPVTMA